MRICTECGQVRPTRWRNAPGSRPPRRIHTAGAVLVDRASGYQRGHPWGRIVDKSQRCDDCGRTLIRGLWALFFEPGAAVLEHGEPHRAPILREATDRDQAPRCTHPGEVP